MGTTSGTGVPGTVRGSRRTNLIAIVVIVAAVAAALFAWSAFSTSEQGLYAVVHDGEGGTTALPLDQDSQTPIQTSLGYNLVVVEQGSVRVSEADCENHDCMGQGAISSPGQQIICLPHKLWIEVSENPEGSGAAMDASATSEGTYDTYAR